MRVLLRQYVESQGITLYRLAKMMGIPEQTVYSWAKGRSQPTYENMDYICTVLNCAISDIIRPEKVDIAAEKPTLSDVQAKNHLRRLQSENARLKHALRGKNRLAVDRMPKGFWEGQ